MADPCPLGRAAAPVARRREPAFTGSTPPADDLPPVSAGSSSPSPLPPVGGGEDPGPGLAEESTQLSEAGTTPGPSGRRILSAGRDTGNPEPGRGQEIRKALGGQPRPGQGLAAMAAAMSEAQLEEHVRSLCEGLGILRFHVRDSRGMNRGLPDDICIGPRGILWRECKTERGRLTPEQKQTGQALTELGYDFGVWRPRDLLSGAVARELAAISGLRLAPPERPGAA